MPRGSGRLGPPRAVPPGFPEPGGSSCAPRGPRRPRSRDPRGKRHPGAGPAPPACPKEARSPAAERPPGDPRHRKCRFGHLPAVGEGVRGQQKGSQIPFQPSGGDWEPPSPSLVPPRRPPWGDLGSEGGAAGQEPWKGTSGSRAESRSWEPRTRLRTRGPAAFTLTTLRNPRLGAPRGRRRRPPRPLETLSRPQSAPY